MVVFIKKTTLLDFIRITVIVKMLQPAALALLYEVGHAIALGDGNVGTPAGGASSER